MSSCTNGLPVPTNPVFSVGRTRTRSNSTDSVLSRGSSSEVSRLFLEPVSEADMAEWTSKIEALPASDTIAMALLILGDDGMDGGGEDLTLDENDNRLLDPEDKTVDEVHSWKSNLPSVRLDKIMEKLKPKLGKFTPRTGIKRMLQNRTITLSGSRVPEPKPGENLKLTFRRLARVELDVSVAMLHMDVVSRNENHQPRSITAKFHPGFGMKSFEALSSCLERKPGLRVGSSSNMVRLFKICRRLMIRELIRDYEINWREDSCKVATIKDAKMRPIRDENALKAILGNINIKGVRECFKD